MTFQNIFLFENLTTIYALNGLNGLVCVGNGWRWWWQKLHMEVCASSWSQCRTPQSFLLSAYAAEQPSWEPEIELKICYWRLNWCDSGWKHNKYQLLTQIAGHVAMEPFLLSTHAELRTREMFRTFTLLKVKTIHSRWKGKRQVTK